MKKKAFVQICDKTNHMVYTRFIQIFEIFCSVIYSLLYHFVLIFKLSLKITTSSFCRKCFLGVRKIYIFYLNVISITFLFSAVLTIHQNCETQDRGESNTSNFSKLKNISMCYPNNKMAVSQAVCSGT